MTPLVNYASSAGRTVVTADNWVRIATRRAEDPLCHVQSAVRGVEATYASATLNSASVLDIIDTPSGESRARTTAPVIAPAGTRSEKSTVASCTLSRLDIHTSPTASGAHRRTAAAHSCVS